MRERESAPERTCWIELASTELAANEFRITQTEDALRREEVKGEINARETHRKVGKAVRDTIMKLGGTVPEDLPPEPHIRRVERKAQEERKGIENNAPPKSADD